jgi:hypothetical protein
MSTPDAEGPGGTGRTGAGSGGIRRTGAGSGGVGPGGTVEGRVGPRRVSRDVAVVLSAVLVHPSIWWVGLATVGRLARRGWWRRPPFLPLPGESYWHFRLVTAFGGTGTEAALEGADVVAYLRWCRKAHPWRG